MKKVLSALMILSMAVLFVACDDDEEDRDKRDSGTSVTYPLFDTLWQVSEVGSGFDDAFSTSEVWVFSSAAEKFTVYNTVTEKYSEQKVVVNETEKTMTLWETKTYDYTHSSSGGTLVIASQSSPSKTYVNFEVSSLTLSDLEGYTESTDDVSRILLMMKSVE